MTNDRALTLVRQDMAAGRQDAAIRRLRAMLASDPGDAVAYRMLTEIHRSRGNLVEAGRWGYLNGDATAAEVAAFEQAHPQPWVRIRLLGRSIDPDRLPSDEARCRLAELQQQATEATIPLQPRGGTRPPALAGWPTPATGRLSDRVPRQRKPPGEQTTSSAAATPADTGTPARARATGILATLRRPFSSRRGRFWQTPGRYGRSFGTATRNYLILGLLIFGGTIGSLVAVAGVRAIFGIDNWFAPIEAILKAVGGMLTGRHT